MIPFIFSSILIFRIFYLQVNNMSVLGSSLLFTIEKVKSMLQEIVASCFEPRTKIRELLTRNLSNEGEADGQEYARTLDMQGEAEAYIRAYSALLTGERFSLRSVPC
jgi:E3 ubiquitin-protein ligase SHPRH